MPGACACTLRSDQISAYAVSGPKSLCETDAELMTSAWCPLPPWRSCATKLPADMGFQAIRVKVEIEGDAPRAVLDEIVQHANLYSPVANSMRNPIAFAIGMA